GYEIPDVVKEDGSYTFIYVAAPVTPHIWLEVSPTRYEAIKMRPFNVSIIIQNVSQLDGLIGVQLILTYNSTYLEVADVIEGDFLKNYAPYGTLVTHYVNHRGLVYGQMILPNSTGHWNPPYPEGNGTVAIVTFMPLKHEAISFNITIEPLFEEFFLDKDGEYMPYLPAKYCHYSYSPLSIPTIVVSPDKYISSYIGETFDINVTILGLDEKWNLTYTEFALTYNSNYLQIIGVSEGPFLQQFGSTVFNSNTSDGCVVVNIALTPTLGYPSGDGTLATIRFNVTSRPPAVSSLTIGNVSLLDLEGFEVLYNLSHGYYEMHEYLVHEIVAYDVVYYVTTLSNGSISPVELSISHRLLKFDIIGIDGTVSFVDITIPKALMWVEDGWLIIAGGEEVIPIVTENATHTTLSFTVPHSSKRVYIIATNVVPEFTPLPLLMILFVTILSSAAANIHLKRKNANL
ncbi:MAG: cohesin domain-containing protein, partial [Candidatus Bathyarchaeia archaeon]